MRGRKPGRQRDPVRGEFGIAARLDAILGELALQFGGGVVAKADVGIGKRLIEDGHADELRKRTTLAAFVRRRDHVAAAGEDRAGDASAERLKKCQLAFAECETDYVAADRQVLDAVHVRPVRPQRIERFVESARIGGNSMRRVGRSCRLCRRILRCCACARG